MWIYTQKYTEIKKSMQKHIQYRQASEQLNKKLVQLHQQFTGITQWTDIINWLRSLQAALKQHPSPYINEKILLSKRLNQCINPILPAKLHQLVLKIHQILFFNMRASVDRDINQYTRLFASDLGVYSLSILPLFAHSTVTGHRLMIINLLVEYYLDLGYQLLPMLMGFIKVILPVYNQTNDEALIVKIQDLVQKIIDKTGRKYVISSIWSCILKFSDCRLAGMNFLQKLIPKMVYRKDQEQFQSSHGFSKEQQELKHQLQLQQIGVQAQKPPQKDWHHSQNRPKSTHSNQQKRMPFELQGLTFSSMQLPQYIVSKLPQKNEKKKFKFKRSQTMATIPVSLDEQKAASQPFTPQLIKQKILNQPGNQAKEHLEVIDENQQEHLMVNQQKIKVSEQLPNIQQNKNSQKDSQKDNDQRINQKSQELIYKKSQILKQGKPKHQICQIKLNKVPLMQLPGIQIIKQLGEGNTNQNNFPNHSTLVINAIITCLDDPSPFIKRAALDFLFTHLRLKSQVLQEDDKKTLTEAMVRLYRKKQMSIILRVDRWLFGRANESGEYIINEKNQFVLQLIINAFMNILSKHPSHEQLCIAPIKIVQNFYTQHQNLVQLTIHYVFIDLIRYIFNYSQGFQFSGEVIKAGYRFFSNIPSHYPRLFHSLGKKLIQGIQENNDHLAYQCIRYIDYCYIKLMKHDHGVEQLQYITITLQYLSQGLKILGNAHKQGNLLYKTYLKDLNLLIYNLISRRQSVQRYMQKQKDQADKKFLAQTRMQQLPLERINYQKQIMQKQQQQRNQYSKILHNLQIFYIQLGNMIKVTPNIQIYEDIYRLSSMGIIKILAHLPTDIKITQLPAWFLAIQYGIRVSSPSVSLAAIDSLIKCLLNADKHPIYQQFKIRIMHDKNKKVGNDYQNLALQKLWALLDYPHMHSKILDLIVAFSKFFPYQFTETVHRSFETHSDPQKQASIQRFSHFWRLTGFKYKDLLISNRQFVQLNKVGLFKMLDFLDDSNPLVRHASKNWMIESLPLFQRVIQPLFFELMKAAGDWYVTPKGLIVIKQIYDTKIIFNTFRRIRSLISNGNYSFLKYVYQQPISNTLEQLRQRVTHISEPILSDLNKNQSIDHQKIQKRQKQPDKSTQKSSAENKRLTYIDMLIILAVRYIQGYTLQSMGIDFYLGNTAVCTSAIQLLQSLISYIDNPSICYKLIQFILPPLSKVLSHSVTNQQYITQIQLLNLFRSIFFNSSFRKKGTTQQIRSFFNNIFTKTVFLHSSLNGLKTPFSYVRTQFVNFITSCIELIANFLQPEQATKCIKQILLTYYKIIKQIRISLIEELLDQEDKKNDKLIQSEKKQQNENKGLLNNIRRLEVRALQEQKIIKISNNLQEVAKTNQILSILHGVSAILNYFFDLDKMSLSQMKFSFQNSRTIFDSFKSILTLGLISSNKSGRLAQKTQFLHNLQTCQSILKDLSPVYETILRAWPLSEQFVRIATEEFSSIGSRVFNFEKFSRYNRVLKDLIDFVNKQKQSIWGKIFSIMQPMFYRFPRQIMQIYLHLWVRQCTNSGQSQGPANLNQPLTMRANVENTQFLMKNIQTIVVSNFPANIIVHAFLQSTLVDQISKFYADMKIQKRQSLSYKISQLQAKLIYFLYIYFTYSYIDQKSLTKQNLLQIWLNILKAIQPFTQSKSPTTSLWILDLINMCAIKYSPKQILTNQKFKTSLHAIINERLKYTASIASKKQIVYYNDPTNQGFNQNTQNKYRIVLPIPPTIFEICKQGQKNRKQTDNCLFQPTKANDYIQLQKVNRLWCFRVLRKLGYQILQNTYLTQKMHFAVIRACEWMQIILPTIQDKSQQNIIYAESASQVLHQLLLQNRLVFIKPLKTSIFRIFDKDDFFICNKNTLQYWAQIIDWIVSLQKNNQTFSLYLQKVTLSNSYFTSATTQNKNRIKSFERICFILYSGSQDKYAHKIKGLLQKIADVIKNAQSSHHGILILILFAIRILILRLSQISINQLFIDIWPMLLQFLMQIFSKKLVKVQIANQISKNPNLLLAALKLIQMISVNNLSSFAHHQWIFVYDYFGIKISLMESTSQLSQIFSQHNQLTELATFTRSQNNTPFLYKPYMNNYFPQHSINYIAQKRENILQYKAIKRKIIIKQASISSQDTLRSYAYLLAQYLISLNQYRVQADLKQVEQVIINDFISLDNFIFKI